MKNATAGRRRHYYTRVVISHTVNYHLQTQTICIIATGGKSPHDKKCDSGNDICHKNSD
jgi:hypothetical protein